MSSIDPKSDVGSRTHGPSPTSNPRPVETTPPSSRLDPSATVTSTPIVFKASGVDNFSSTKPYRRDANKRLGKEMDDKFLPLMLPDEFLNKYLPLDDTESACPESNWPEIHTGMKEVGMYPLFIEAANRIGTVTFFDSSKKPDPRCDNICVDVSARVKDDVSDPSEEKLSQSQKKKSGFSRIELYIEFKRDVNDDPFRDEENDKLFRDQPLMKNARVHNTDQSKRTLGQIGSYTAAVLGMQFRVHLFSVLICGEYARLMCWHRGMASVTRRFKYQDSQSPLTEFIWRYSRLDRAQRGHDLTVTPWNESDPRNQWLRREKEELKRHNELHEGFRQMIINDRDDPAIQKTFLISYPQDFTARSPFGRATRGMIGCNLDLEGNRSKMVYIKDYWRPEGGETEGEIYRSLEEKNVPNIPRFYCGNDVCHEVRRHNVVQERRDNPVEVRRNNVPQKVCETVPKPKTHSVVHYRMALDRVGRKLTEFRSTRELVTAIADAMEAHDAAYHDAKILHRDISAGNIMISGGGGGGGFLIDWDMCVRVEEGAEPSGRVERTGTWQFMSVALLQNNQHVHGIVDDRESAFHLLTWSALRYTAHSRHANMGLLMDPYDEAKVDCDGNVEGGSGKMNMIQNGLKVIFHPPALHKLIDELRIFFRERYRDLTSDAKAYPQLYPALEAEHHKKCEVMQKCGSLVDIFRRWLASGDWSEDSAAQENYTQESYTYKRKALKPPTDSHRSSKSRKSNPPTNSYCSSKSRRSNGGSRK